MEKEFGKLTREQIGRLYAQYHEFNQCKEASYDFSRSYKDLDQILMPWAGFYELNFNTFAALFAEIMGWLEPLKEIIKEDDPQEAWLDFSEAALSEDVGDIELDDEDKSLLFSMMQAIIGNVTARSTFHQTLSQLVIRVRQGDDEALFKAVFIDRSALSSPTIAKRIAKAQATEDEAFLNRLAKAITRTNPRRPDPERDDQRFIIELLNDAVGGLDNLTAGQVFDIVYEELELNSSEADCSLSALRKFLKKRKQLRGEL